jgi:hypothetical protein
MEGKDRRLGAKLVLRKEPMAREMLINVAESEECRVAVVDNRSLEELYIERASLSTIFQRRDPMRSKTSEEENHSGNDRLFRTAFAREMKLSSRSQRAG